jgi:ArsR family transcriptional regulator
MDNADDILTFSENFGKGIGNSTRFKMLTFLAGGPRSVGEIADHLNISQSTASQHLLVLKNGQLITNEKRGLYVYYSLDVEYMLKGLKGITAILEKKSLQKEIHEQ